MASSLSTLIATRTRQETPSLLNKDKPGTSSDPLPSGVDSGQVVRQEEDELRPQAWPGTRDESGQQRLALHVHDDFAVEGIMKKHDRWWGWGIALCRLDARGAYGWGWRFKNMSLCVCG